MSIINQNTTTCKSPIDSIYFIGLIFALLYLLRTQVYWSIPSFVQTIFKLLSFVLVSIRLFMYAIPRMKGDELIIACFCLILCFIVGNNTGEDVGTYRLYITFALIFGAKGLSLKKVLNYYVITGVGFCFITYLGSRLGLVENFSTYNYLSDFRLISVGYRNSFGYISPTDFANHVLYLLLAYYLYKGGIFKKNEYIVLITIICYVSFYSDARLMLGSSSILLFFSYICKKFKKGDWQSLKKIKSFLIIGMLIIPISVFLVVNDYNSGSGEWQLLDVYTSGRLALSSDAMKYVGPSWFGQYYKMIGIAAADTLRGREEYNYIDCSFIQLVVIYGIVYTIVLLFSFFYIVQKYIKRNEFVIPFAVLIAFIEAIFAQHLMLIEFNPILLALFTKNDIENNFF